MPIEPREANDCWNIKSKKVKNNGKGNYNRNRCMDIVTKTTNNNNNIFM